jgi:hypothetical protein
MFRPIDTAVTMVLGGQVNAEPRRECAIMRRRRSLAEWGAVVSLSVVRLVSVAQAQPSADEVLVNAGLTAADKQSVLGGQFVSVSVGVNRPGFPGGSNP